MTKVQPTEGIAPGPDARARGDTRWPIIVRATWALLAATAVGLAVAGIPARYDGLLEISGQYERALGDLGLSSDFYASYVTVLGMAVVLSHLLIAGVISWRRPDDWMALFVSVALLANGAINPLSPVLALAVAHPALDPPVNLVIYLGVVSAVSLLYLFPNGRFFPSWTLPLALVWALLNLPAVFFPDAALSFPQWPALVQSAFLLGWAGSGVFAQVQRYTTVSTLVQRQQAKWAVPGLTIAALGPFAYFLPFDIIPSVTEASVPSILYRRIGSDFFTLSMLFRLAVLGVFTLAMLSFPLSFAVAILRYRLWDIGTVVNRALVYAALTATLLAIYFVSVVVLQLAFRPITDRGGDAAIVITTLVIAALFQPARRRVQDLIDRRFYRSKYDAAQTLATLSATMRDEVDLDRLSQAVVTVVKETMQPAHVSLWLSGPSKQDARLDGEANRKGIRA